MELLLSWVILSLSVWITAEVLPGFHVKSFGGAFKVAAIYGVFSVLLGWMIWSVLAIATLGIALLFAFLTRWIVAAIILTITDKVSDTLTIDSFGWAMGGAALISLLGTVGEWMLGRAF